ncbi:unnamed protein product [Tenebrio molitor]|nr:unnamed protein product [Tenebrio molitor]
MKRVHSLSEVISERNSCNRSAIFPPVDRSLPENTFAPFHVHLKNYHRLYLFQLPKHRRHT